MLVFYILFGFMLVYTEEQDASRYAEYLKEKATLPFSDISNLFISIWEGNQKPDFFQRLIEFVVSRFTVNEYVEFSILSFLLAFFTYRLVIKVKGNVLLSPESYFFLLFILLLLFPGRLLSFRHYFATIVFSMGLYNFFILKDYKYLAVLIFPVFIHFGFLMILPLFIILFIFRDNNYFYYGLILLSYSFSGEVTSFLALNITGLEGDIEQSFRGYTNKEYIDFKSNLLESGLAIINFLPIALRYSFFVMAFLVHRKVKLIIGKDLFYSFTLVFFSFLILFSENTAISDRFSVSYAIIVSVYLVERLKHVQIQSNLFHFLRYTTLIWASIVILRQMLDFMNIFLVGPFSFLGLFLEERYSIISLIR